MICKINYTWKYDEKILHQQKFWSDSFIFVKCWSVILSGSLGKPAKIQEICRNDRNLQPPAGRHFFPIHEWIAFGYF